MPETEHSKAVEEPSTAESTTIAPAKAVTEKKSVTEMLGESSREIAVLVLVFGFLDRLITDKPLNLWWTSGTLGVAGLSLLLGVLLERLR